MELVIKGASKFLGNCKAGNICKELKKLKEKDTASLEATNTTLSSQVHELKVILALKKDEIRVLKEQQAEYLGRIREVIGHSGDIVNKAHLFDNKIKIEGHLSAQKIITILVKYGHKMETTLGEMWKLLPGPSIVAGLSGSNEDRDARPGSSSSGGYDGSSSSNALINEGKEDRERTRVQGGKFRAVFLEAR